MTDNRPSLEVVEELAAIPSARADIEAMLPALERHAQPCGAQAVIAALMPLVSLYGVSDRSDKEWAGFFRFYHQALADMPLEALHKGIAEYVQREDSAFFPKPGPLKAICGRYAGPIVSAVWRSQRVLKAPAPRQFTPEEVEERRRVAGEVLATLKTGPNIAETGKPTA